MRQGMCQDRLIEPSIFHNEDSFRQKQFQDSTVTLRTILFNKDLQRDHEEINAFDELVFSSFFGESSQSYRFGSRRWSNGVLFMKETSLK